jgi:hypothetical protein
VSLLLDFQGRDTDIVFLKNALSHWLTLNEVQKQIREKRLIKPEEIEKLAVILGGGDLDKAFLAKVTRSVLFDKTCLRVITQAIVSTHEDESFLDMVGQLRQLRDELKPLAKLSKSGLVAAGSSPTPAPTLPPEERKSPGGIILP